MLPCSLKMKLELQKLKDLIPYAENAKLHNQDQISKLAKSITEFGFNNPVLLDSDLGIIAGHGRVLAAKELGLENIPCIILGHLTETEKKAYIIADNRLGELGGGWDIELLKKIFGELSQLETNLSDTGFDEAFIHMLEGEIVNDPNKEWGGMPEYENNYIGPWQSIVVHFQTPDDAMEFAKLINQPITEKTKTFWFPEVAREGVKDQRY